MLRDTMIKTMPLAMMAIDALWTDRFHRLREVRNRPPDPIWKPIQMMASATIMPMSRVSTSSNRTSAAKERSDGGVGRASAAATRTGAAKGRSAGGVGGASASRDNVAWVIELSALS